MKTEEMHRTPRSRDPNEVSRALQELTPLSCVIVDRRGRSVPLSSAGYVLRFGRSYRMRIRSPFPDDEVDSVRIISPPAFLTLEPELREIDEAGRSVRTIPFTVSGGWLRWISRLTRWACTDELEVSYHFRPGVLHQPPIFLCPIVARPLWSLVIIAVLTGLLTVLLERIVSDFAFAERRAETMRLLAESVWRWDTWLWLVAITAAVWLTVTLANTVTLYRRSRELQHAFQERYPCV
jgi:hypothetical protein